MSFWFIRSVSEDKRNVSLKFGSLYFSGIKTKPKSFSFLRLKYTQSQAKSHAKIPRNYARWTETIFLEMKYLKEIELIYGTGNKMIQFSKSRFL